MIQNREDIRNVAIIAHVDHGKTTLVDQLLKQGGIFRKNQVVADRVMDSNELEKERGITILSKNTAIHYKDKKINIIDTPGHADFGGEVERVLKMVNGVILVVDAFEGVMPQTKFVLQKAIELQLPVITCINKIDRVEARAEEVEEEVLELMLDLEADDQQLDCPFVYASAREGTASLNREKQNEDMTDLLEVIIDHIPAPKVDLDGPTQLLISTIDYNDYIGRIGIGKIERGSLSLNQEIMVVNALYPEQKQKMKITKLYEFEGLKRKEITQGNAGDIIAISGLDNIQIGDTVCDVDHPEALSFAKISEPTIQMLFSVNDSPFAGTEGDYVTSRHLRDRLFKAVNTDLSLRIEETDSADSFKVSGRGELHLSILIETMRREGYEFQVSQPIVLFKTIDGQQYEPMEKAILDVPEECVGSVIEKLGAKKGELLNMTSRKGDSVRLEFSIPARGLIGYGAELMTDTKGRGILNTTFEGYAPYKGAIPKRLQGSLVAFEAGEAMTYGLYNAQERGILFITPGTKVYEGMVVGQNPRAEDIEVNVCRRKHATNMRASGSDDALRLSPPKIMSLEEALEFIVEDELLEITPKNLRIRKKILNSSMRQRMRKKNKDV
ncbi:MAG: translational GTPase TypA [Epulopiscium sp.]|nr:translational GTPase TypA [Candidatus Epulonipiscium sp.]